MGKTLWEKLIHFIKICYQEKFSTLFKSCLLGLIASMQLLWSGSLAASLVIYVLKGMGTLLLTAGTTLTGCYISYRFDKWKEKQSSDKPKKKNRKAA